MRVRVRVRVRVIRARVIRVRVRVTDPKGECRSPMSIATAAKVRGRR